MKSKSIKIAATSLVLVLAFAGLLYSTLRDGTEYYKHVDEVMSDPQPGRASACSCTATSSTTRSCSKPDTLEYRFQVQNNGKIVQAELHRHRARHVQGRIRSRAQGTPEPADGFSVEPNGVMAKCPSKYEAGPPVPRDQELVSHGHPRHLPPARQLRRLPRTRSPPRWPARGAARAG